NSFRNRCNSMSQNQGGRPLPIANSIVILQLTGRVPASRTRMLGRDIQTFHPIDKAVSLMYAPLSTYLEPAVTLKVGYVVVAFVCAMELYA
ncbi:hypothetical protein JI435_302350, partial [Parastagonospora nodorum SN15]